MKKGMMLTLGCLLIALEIMALVAIINTNNFQSGEILTDVVLIDNLEFELSGIENGFSEIFNKTTGIKISRSGNSISFVDNIPNNNISLFVSEFNLFENFIGDKYNITYSNINQAELFLSPTNLIYKHETPTRVNVSGKNVVGYSVSFYIDENVSSCVTDYNSGDIVLGITVTGTDDTCVLSESVSNESESRVVVNGNYIVIVKEGKLSVQTDDAKITPTIVIDTGKRSQVMINANVTYENSAFNLTYINKIPILK